MNRSKIDFLLLCSYLLAVLMTMCFSGQRAGAQVIISKNVKPISVFRNNKRTFRRPPALLQPVKLKMAQQILSATGKKVASLGAVATLTPERTYLPNFAHLLFLKPDFVNNDDGIGEANLSANPAADTSVSPTVWLVFNPPSPGSYLIDFTVFSFEPIKYTLGSQGSIITNSATNGKEPHLLVVAQTYNANEEIDISLTADKGWTFESCDISRIN